MSLDDKLLQALDILTSDGQYISAKEFLIIFTEYKLSEHTQVPTSPLQVRYAKTIEAIKLAFKDELQLQWATGYEQGLEDATK